MVNRDDMYDTKRMTNSVGMRAKRRKNDIGIQVDLVQYSINPIDINDKAALCVAYDRFLDIQAKSRGWK